MVYLAILYYAWSHVSFDTYLIGKLKLIHTSSGIVGAFTKSGVSMLSIWLSGRALVAGVLVDMLTGLRGIDLLFAGSVVSSAPGFLTFLFL